MFFLTMSFYFNFFFQFIFSYSARPFLKHQSIKKEINQLEKNEISDDWPPATAKYSRKIIKNILSTISLQFLSQEIS